MKIDESRIVCYISYKYYILYYSRIIQVNSILMAIFEKKKKKRLTITRGTPVLFLQFINFEGRYPD